MDSNMLNALLVLLAGIAFLAIIAFILRRLASGRASTHGLPIRIISRQPIGGKAALVVADVGDKRLLLGVTEHSVTLLATLERTTSSTTSKTTAPRVTPAPQMHPPSPAELSFRAYLASMFQRTEK
ncbi:MAG: flagellar biosynthetic protein FliO [Chlorobi bacterium]|nr:flagellar biosynthetic protein FliO [Chlorobiota bacterium]